MLPKTLTTLKVQAPARIRALKVSYGIAASKSAASKAQELAPTVNAYRPGIYHVGACVVDLWRMSCTCKESRARKSKGIQPGTKPCVHFLALYLRGEWTPVDPDPVKYLKSVQVEQPELIAVYCHAKLPACYPAAPQGYRILETNGETVELENVATGTHATTKTANIYRLLPFYE